MFCCIEGVAIEHHRVGVCALVFLLDRGGRKKKAPNALILLRADGSHAFLKWLFGFVEWCLSFVLTPVYGLIISFFCWDKLG